MTEHPTRDFALGSPVSPEASGLVRASDAERAAIIERVHVALGEGRLDTAEAEERSAAAVAARYRQDLEELVTDLPGPAPVAPPGGWHRIWRDAVGQVCGALGVATGDGPSPRQRRLVAFALVGAVLWAMAFLLAGFAWGLVG